MRAATWNDQLRSGFNADEFTDLMTPTEARAVREALRSALASAMARRDRAAMAVYRTALSAIDNAEAVPLGQEHRAGGIERPQLELAAPRPTAAH